MVKVHSLDQCSFSIAQGSRFCASSFVQWTSTQKGFWMPPVPWIIAFWNSQGTSHGHVPSIPWAFFVTFLQLPCKPPCRWASIYDHCSLLMLWFFFSSCYAFVTVPNLTYKFYISFIIVILSTLVSVFYFLYVSFFSCNINISRSTWLIFGEK